MDDHPKALPMKVKKEFPSHNPKSLEQYIKQWRKAKYKSNTNNNITGNKNDTISIPDDYKKLTPDVLERLIINALKRDQSANMIRTANDFYIKIKKDEPDHIENIDMKKFLKNVS